MQTINRFRGRPPTAWIAAVGLLLLTGGGCVTGEEGEGGDRASAPAVPEEISRAYFAEESCCEDDTPCQDGLFCNGRETCNCWGECEPPDPTFNPCYDADPCTSDSCDELRDMCPHTPLPGPGCPCSTNADCDDSNLCTQDICDAGSARCTYNPVGCDDGDICTTDGCDPLAGCVHAPISCDDGNACTVDVCDPAGGGCTHTGLACGDGNPCTDDSCDPMTGCVNRPNTVPCEDGDPCTTGDRCSGGVCRSGALLTCDDGNVCTNDLCVTGLGCAHTNNTSPCNDGNPCTLGDVCNRGSCLGTLRDCSDTNVCTDDSCDPSTGACVHTNNTASCDDGNRCTINDRCAGGSCGGTPRDCNDANVCTIDGCEPARGCTYSANTGASCTPSTPAPSPVACYAGSCDATGSCVWVGTRPSNDSCVAPYSAANITLDASGHGSASGDTTCALHDYQGQIGSTAIGVDARDVVYHIRTNVGEDFQLYAYRTYLNSAGWASALYDRRYSCSGAQVLAANSCTSNDFLDCGSLGLTGTDAAFVLPPRPIGTDAFDDYLFVDGEASPNYGAFTVDVSRIAFENGIPCQIGATPAYYYQPDVTRGGRFRGHILSYPGYRNVTGCAASPYYQSRFYGYWCWVHPDDGTGCFRDDCWPWDTCWGGNRDHPEDRYWPANAWFLLLPTTSTRYRITVNDDSSSIPTSFDAVISLKRVIDPMDCPRYVTSLGCQSVPGRSAPTVWEFCVPGGQHYEIGVSKRVYGDQFRSDRSDYELIVEVLGPC